LFKTGDVCRYLPEGDVEFLGRSDSQIKIRGYRIEPGEIEAVLKRHDGVQQVVVVGCESTLGEAQLVAYCVFDPAKTPNRDELRDFLRARIPAYMMPAIFVPLQTLPLTRNGKVNRRALPPPDLSHSRKDMVVPRNPTEELLAEIWSEVLGVKPICVFDDFFEIGGHSLKATQVMSRVCAVFQLDLPLRTLFEAGSVATLAEVIEKNLINELEDMSEEEAERLSENSISQ
jgi:acyl carrier protein